MAKRTCVEPKCTEPRKGLGLCQVHYRRYKKRGTTADPKFASHEDRFWAKVDKRGPNDCWPWTAGLDGDGYGSFRPGGSAPCMAASRYSWLLAHPHIAITPMHIVCHRCDNRACVNPAHLFLGSTADNVRDKHAKGRANTWNATKGPRRPPQPRKPRQVSLPLHRPISAGSFQTQPRPPKEKAPCRADGCTREAETRGYCAKDYKRFMAHGDTESRKPGKPYMGRTVEQVKAVIRAKTKVNSTGCWEWTGGLSNKGYPSLRWGSIILGHRVSYTVHVAPIPDGMFVCHRCDNPRCVNPDHLFIGTAAENHADMTTKGRQRTGFRVVPRGADHPNAKLTAQQVAEIKASNERGVDLAKRYGVAQQTICGIRKGRRWLGPDSASIASTTHAA